ncbi:MAG: GNAT family N-acetyltransferase, partial [Nocardioides sp.]|nr:GNAT family N-acetyltransferase [Nocardioides sp.]
LRVSEMSGGVRIDVGEPGRSAEYVVTDAPDVLEPAVVEVRSTPGAQLLVVTKDAAATRVWLADGGLVVSGERTLRQTDLREHPARELPDGYKVEVSHAGGAIYATVSDEAGARAASGRLSVFGGDAVADRIETDEAHRRRGLAAAVMSTLAAEARDAGATRGLVAAYDDGDALYEALGWETIAQVVVATARSKGA